MTPRLLITGAVAIGCITAAGAGGYLAVRTATETSEAAQVVPLTIESTSAPQAAASAAAPRVPPAPAQPEPAVTRTATTPAAAPRAPRHPGPAASTAPPPVPRLAAEPAELPAQSAALPAIAEEPSVPEPSVAATAADVPAPLFEPFELPANAVIGIRLDTSVSSETARVEDPVTARVTRAVAVDDVTIIPAGARMNGSVTLVDRGGRIRDRARIGIRFTSVTVGDNVRVPIHTDAIYREGDAPGGEATAKIGASAVVGSILGGVFGGKKGAAIGGAAGAAGGTAMVVSGGRNEAALASGTTLTVRLVEPAEFHIER